jgi:hypothetical protein
MDYRLTMNLQATASCGSGGIIAPGPSQKSIYRRLPSPFPRFGIRVAPLNKVHMLGTIYACVVDSAESYYLFGTASAMIIVQITVEVQ